jgi:quinol-cytochrome oxidoreductase complex cytochrome b subunit
MRRSLNSFTIVKILYDTGISYPAPSNLSTMWNFGIYALVCLAAQIVTGIFLAMHYTPDVGLAFISVEHIMRDVENGWILRYLHANGASMFFVVVYIHMLRGLYYGSFMAPRQYLWISGVIIFLLMILTAFLGYVLPWGQMSFWGATVITNLASAIPIFGKAIVIQIWGGYSIDNATLIRFFSLHYLLPFIILGLVVLHLILLHEVGSNNPLGISFKGLDFAAFTPYYVVKDFLGVLLFLFIFLTFVFFYPNILGHPDNYIPANPLVTPPHIVPEWYFLLFYGILRSIPNKFIGVVALLSAIIVLIIFPYLTKSIRIRTMEFRILSKVVFWFFTSFSVLLAWIGSQPVVFPYVGLGLILTLFYFLYFVFLYNRVLELDEEIISFLNQNSDDYAFYSNGYEFFIEHLTSVITNFFIFLDQCSVNFVNTVCKGFQKIFKFFGK